MKIALMTNNYKPFLGGVPISVERLAKALRAKGHEVTVFAPTYKGQMEEEGVFRYASCLQHFYSGTVLPNPFDRRIREEFERQSFDVIHVHHPVLIGHTAVRMSRRFRIPLTFTYHTRYEQYLSYLKGIRVLEGWKEKRKRFLGPLADKVLFLLKDKLIPFYLRCFLRHCDSIFAPTEGMKEYLHDTCKIEVSRLTVLPTGLEARSIYPNKCITELRERYQALNCPLFLSVSRMSHEKNVEFLIESIALAKKKLLEQGNYRKFKVVFVGDGPDRPAYERLCVDLRVADEVVFAGSVPNEEIAPYYAAADAFLFASKTETQGIVILEAFAGGTPVYAVDASGVRDLVVNGVNGRLFPEDREKFADALVHLLNSEETSSLAEGARQTAMQYLEENIVHRAIMSYTDVCQQRAGQEWYRYTERHGY